MQNTHNYKEAGALLVSALRNTRTGFVARVKVTPGHLDAARTLTMGRRTMAKVSGQSGTRDYSRAMTVPEDGNSRGRFFADCRGMLAELVVDDLMAASGVDYAMQPFVSNKPASEMDLSFSGRKYDVKAAGQMSPEWSAGPTQAGRLYDDRYIAINYIDHLDYLLEEGAAGYVCVYFYVSGGVPVAADVFYYTMEQVHVLEVHEPPEHSAHAGKDMRHYRVPPHFPDARHYDGYYDRKGAMEAAGFVKSPFTPLTKAA